MKSLIIIGLMALIANCIVSTFGTRIFLQDPLLVPISYFNTVAISGTTSDRFADMDNFGKLCIESLNAVHFSYVSETGKARPTDYALEIQQRTTDIRSYYNHAETTDYIDVDVRVDVEVQKATGYNSNNISIPCIPCSFHVSDGLWALAPGLDNSHFYVISNDVRNGRFAGLVEEVLTAADEEINHNRSDLESIFRLSQYSYSGTLGTDYLSVHDLDSFNRLRACGSVYASVWAVDAVNVILQKSVANSQGLLMIAKSFQFSTITDNQTVIPVKIIPCAINTDVTRAQFYLTADLSDKGAAYVLTKVPRQRSETYEIAMRVTNVAGLEKLYT